MFLFVRRAAVFLACFVVLVASAKAQSEPQPDDQLDEAGRWRNGVTEPWWFESKDRYTDEEIAEAKRIWNEIGNGEAGGGWAGTYSDAEGEVNMVYLRWSPRHGYVRFHIYTCLPDVRRIDYGKVEITDSALEFTSARRTAADGGATAPVEYVMVKWGEQHHLVPENEIEYFFNYTSGRGDIPEVNGMQKVNYFSKHGDWDKPIADVPVVPAAYAEYIKKPLAARIVKIGKSYKEYDPDAEAYYELVTPVTLNVGSNDGFKRGMVLHVSKSAERETVELTRVGRTSAQGIIVRSMRRTDVPLGENEPNIEHDYPPIEVGWQLSTSPHKQR